MSLAQKALSAMAWDFIGKLGLMFLRFGESVLLVHLLGNQHYGILSSVLNVHALALLISALGIEGCLSRFFPETQLQENSDQSAALLWKAFQMRVLTLLGVCLVCWGSSGWLAQWHLGESPVSTEQLVSYFQVLPWLIAVSSLQELFRRMLVIHYQQRWINGVDLWTTAAYLGVAWLGIQYGQWSVFEVLLLNVAYKALILVLLGRFAVSYLKPGASLDSSFWKSIYPYAGYAYLYALLLFVLGKGADIFILSSVLGDAQQVAWYTIAYNLAFFSSGLIELAFHGGFLLPLFSELVQRQETERLRKVYVGVFELVYLLTMPLTFGGVVLSSDLITWLYGVENLPAATLLAWLFVFFAITKIGILNVSFMLTMDMQRVLVVSRAFFGIFNIVLNIGLVAKYEALGVVYGTLLSGTLSTLFECVYVHYKVQPRYPWKFLVKVSLLSVMMALSIYGGQSYVTLSGVSAIGVWCTWGVFFYVVGIYYLRPFSKEVLEIAEHIKLPLKHRWLNVLK